MSEFPFFLRLNAVPLHVHATLFIRHSSRDACVAPPLAVVNNVAVDKAEHLFEALFAVISGIYLEGELLGHMIVLFFLF